MTSPDNEAKEHSSIYCLNYKLTQNGKVYTMYSNKIVQTNDNKIRNYFTLHSPDINTQR